MAHILDFGQFFDIWPWPVTLTTDKDHCDLDHLLRRIGLYLGLWVCGSNRLWDMETGQSNFYFKRFSWLIWAQKFKFQKHQKKLFNHHIKFEVDRSNGFEIIWNRNFPGCWATFCKMISWVLNAEQNHKISLLKKKSR